MAAIAKLAKSAGKSIANAVKKTAKKEEDILGGSAGKGVAEGNYQKYTSQNYVAPKNAEELKARYPVEPSAEYKQYNAAKSETNLTKQTAAPSQKPIAESSTTPAKLTETTTKPNTVKAAEPVKTATPAKTPSVGKQLVKGAVTTAAIGGLTAGAMVGIPALVNGLVMQNEDAALDPNKQGDNPWWDGGGGSLPYPGGEDGDNPYYPGYPGPYNPEEDQNHVAYIGGGGDPGEEGGGVFSSGTLGSVGEIVSDNLPVILAIGAVIVVIVLASRPDKKTGTSGKKSGKKPAGKRRASA